MKILSILSLLILSSAAYGQWVKQPVNTTAAFRGLSVVNEKVVWASGTGGTVIRTIDAGKTWDVITVPDAGKLDFRDIEAFDVNTAYILSIGNGAEPDTDMGPLITREHRDRVAGYIGAGQEAGATVVVDGRETTVPEDGFFLGTTCSTTSPPR